MSTLLNDPEGVAASGVPGDGQPKYKVAFGGKPDAAAKLPTIPEDYFTRDRPIRLWEVFDDPHFARLFTDEDYFWQYTAQTPFGQSAADLPHYRDIAMRGAAEAAMAKIWGAPADEISDTYAAHRMGLSLSLKGYEVRSDAEIFAMLGQAAEESAAWQEVNLQIVLENKERENLIQNLFYQTVRSNTSEGVLAGVEGVSRGSGHVAENFASENERRTTEDLQAEISELQKPNPMRGLAGLSMRASRERIADIERVLKNREMGMGSSVNRGPLRNGVQVTGDYLTAFADATARTRSNVDAAYPVTEEFRASLGGQIYGALAGAPSELATYTVLPLGVTLTAGQLYNSTYYEALDKGVSPTEAHRAGLLALPAMPIEAAMDKLVLGKILTGLKGKVTLGELQKTLLLTAPAGGLTEGTQQLWANFNAKYLSEYDPQRNLDDEIIRSILIGTIVDATAATGGQAGAGLYSDKASRMISLSKKLIPIVKGISKFKNFSEARQWLNTQWAGKPISTPALGGDIVLTRATAKKMTSASAVAKSTSVEVHLAAIKVIPELAKNAVALSHPDRANDPHITAIHRLYAPMELGGKLHRVKLTVKEIAAEQNEQRLYSLEAVEIEVPAWSPAEAGLESVGDSKGSAPTAHAGFITVDDLLPKSIYEPSGSEEKGVLMSSSEATDSIDPNPNKVYEKVIRENHSTLRKHLADQSRDFEAAVIAADYRGDAGSGAESSEGFGGRNLSKWASASGKLIPENKYSAFPILSETTSEHTVYVGGSDSRVIKKTRDLYYGEIPVPEIGAVVSRSATPAEYLRRMALQIAVFHSDLKLEGISIQGESSLLNNPADAPHIVISQPWYKSVGPATKAKIADYLSSAGFREIPNSFFAWVREADGVVIQDATPENFILTEAGLIPIDLQMNVFTPEQMREAGLGK